MDMDAPVVWEAGLDQRYLVRVTRTEPYNGKLEVLEVLMETEVTLSYDAKFGPDAGDVMQWQEIATRFIDGRPTLHAEARDGPPQTTTPEGTPGRLPDVQKK